MKGAHGKSSTNRKASVAKLHKLSNVLYSQLTANVNKFQEYYGVLVQLVEALERNPEAPTAPKWMINKGRDLINSTK